MPKRQTTARVNIPTLLADSVKNKRAILFLGAGASKEAKNAANQTPPDADQLRDILAARFFAQPMKGRDVMAVAEMAIASRPAPAWFSMRCARLSKASSRSPLTG
jgi:ribosomal protein S12 methylthiotransferase accessory factor YcaO